MSILKLEIRGFPCGSAGKESTCNVGDLGLIPGLGRSPGEGKGYPPQYSGLENSMGSVIHVHAHTYRHLRDLSILKLEVALDPSHSINVL